MRLSGTGARQKSCQTLGPHTEGPPEAGVSKDAPQGSVTICDHLRETAGLSHLDFAEVFMPGSRWRPEGPHRKLRDEAIIPLFCPTGQKIFVKSVSR